MLTEKEMEERLEKFYNLVNNIDPVKGTEIKDWLIEVDKILNENTTAHKDK